MIAVYGPWAAELTLEVIGAALYLRRSKILYAYFTIAALMEVVTFAVFSALSRTAYAWSYWAETAILKLMLIWLACSICGMFVAERRKSMATISAAFLSLASAALITVFAANGETLKNKLLDGEIAANMILLAVVFIGWIGRRDRLTGMWKFISLGFMVMVGSDLVFTILWTFWDGARHFYPIGCISAQVIWICGPLRKIHLPEFRRSLGHEMPEVQKVTLI